MANAFTEYGIDLHWGLGATAVTVTNAIGIFQSIENELKIDEQEIRDQRGNVVTWIGYNPTQQATLVGYQATTVTPAKTAPMAQAALPSMMIFPAVWSIRSMK